MSDLYNYLIKRKQEIDQLTFDASPTPWKNTNIVAVIEVVVPEAV